MPLRRKLIALGIVAALALAWWDLQLIGQALAPRPSPFLDLDRQ